MDLWKKIIIISSAIGIVTFLLLFMAFNSIFQIIVKDQTALKKRNEVRDFYLKLPIPMEFKVYFFNVTNPMEVQQGEIPILQQIGPYVYNLYKEKILIEENEAEDTLTYTPSDFYEFSQEKSGNLTQDDNVTILNPLIAGMVNQVLRDTPPFISLLNKAINSIFKDIQSIYLTVKVRNILFDGITINCKVNDYAAQAVCTQIKAKLNDLKEQSKNIFLFSIFGSRNGTQSASFKILRGITNSHDLGRLAEYNNEKMLKIWSTAECNRFHGTDGWIFPPFLEKNEGIWTFSNDLCRNMHLEYVDDRVVKGVPVRRYETDLGDQSKNPEEKCYCPSMKNCLNKGLFDLSKCLGVPIYASLPHFLRTDPYYLNKVKGLHPVEDEHIIFIDFEYMTGVPVVAKKRLQLNLQIQKVDKIDLMKNLTEVLHPILWIEEGIELEGDLLKKVATTFVLLKIVDVIKYFILILSITGIGYGIYLYNRNRNLATITPIHKDHKTLKGYINRVMSRNSLNTP